MNPKNKLGMVPVPKLLFQFAVPSIISMIVGALYNIVDQFFIGHSVGELGNAATNVAFPLSTSCLALALLFGVGGAAAFNLTMGRGKPEQAIHYIGNAAVMLFISGAFLCVITNLFLEPLLIAFGAPSDVLPYAMDYTGITAFGFPFLILSTGGGHLVRADGNPRAAMLCNIVGALINTVLDAVFVFVLQMGMKGAALATVIGQIVAAMLILSYLIRYKTVKLEWKHLRLKWNYTSMLTKLGVANFFNQIAMMIVQIILNKSLTYYGAMSQYGEAIPLACAGIISKVGMVFFSICIGLSHGMQPIASFNYGAENYRKVKEVYLLALKIGTAISVVAFLLFQFFPRQIIDFFGSSQSEAYYLFATRYFRIYMFFTFLNAVQPISSNLFTSIGKPEKGVFLSLTRQILFLLPLIVIFPLFAGIDGIMYAAPIADLVAAVVSLVLVKKEFFRINQLIEKKENEV
ncbi:MAG: MATE family efflux transporter [Lachnospiraceae bacterium]|nr:MATE family efflux transporter [Lachnospiraceae bacterium]